MSEFCKLFNNLSYDNGQYTKPSLIINSKIIPNVFGNSITFQIDDVFYANYQNSKVDIIEIIPRISKRNSEQNKPKRKKKIKHVLSRQL